MITFTGDLFIGNNVITIEESVLDKMNASDYVFSNFECVLDVNGLKKREDKNAILLTSSHCLEKYLEHFDTKIIFGLGNNHIHDHGEEGLIHLKKELSKHDKIQITGVGLSNEVRNPLVLEVRNKKIAFLTASTDEPEVMAIISTNNKQGVLDYSDNSFIDIIKQTKQKTDLLILFPHWGEEIVVHPIYQIRKLAYKWIEAGADLVIGNHPHIIQGKEIYKDKHIYYSLGNYIFANYYDKRNYLQRIKKESNHSIMLQLLFNNNISVKETGLYFDSNKNRLFESSKSLSMLKNASYALNTKIVPYKKYHGICQKEKYKKLKKRYSILYRIKHIIKRKHRKHSLVKLIYLKVTSTFLK